MRRPRSAVKNLPFTCLARLGMALGVATMFSAGLGAPAQAAALYSASINPTSVATSHTVTYALSISNDAASSNHLGSANVTVPTGFSAVTLGTPTVTGGKIWTANLVAGVIELRGTAVGQELVAGETLSVNVTATAPAVVGLTTWTTAARNNLSFGGVSFTLTGPVPTVNVVLNSAPTATVSLSPTDPSTDETITATATGSDADSDTVTLSYVWKVNGSPISGETGTSLDLSQAGYGDPGDIVSVEVTPNDGFVDGTAATASATVVNLYTISGLIRTRRLVPIPGVSVTRSGSATPVVTDTNGYYVFTGVKPGLYGLTASKSGFSFVPPTSWIRVTVAPRGANFIAVMDGLQFGISGRLTTMTGAAIPGVSVALSPAPVGVVSPLLTNSAGYFYFEQVPDGATYTITPSKLDVNFSPASRVVTLSGTPATNQNFVGTTGYVVSGRVSTSTGIQVPGVTVELDGAVSVVTNSAGYFKFYEVADGSHTIRPSRPGTTFSPPLQTITVSGAGVSGVNFIASGP